MISNAALNACLNGLSGVLLACGYAAIRAGKKNVHKVFMLSAVGVSSLFLISYLTYHIRVGKAVLFQGQGWIRPAYFSLLTSHTILAAAWSDGHALTPLALARPPRRLAALRNLLLSRAADPRFATSRSYRRR